MSANEHEQAMEAQLRLLAEQVDAWTADLLERSVSPGAKRFGHMLAYHLGWRDEQLQPLPEPAPSGKKLRPAAVLLVCEAAGGQLEQARGAAVAVELVHNFSLVHDDIQDRSELRRHRRTLWTLWGIEQGINAGDALFALAQSALLEGDHPNLAQMALALNQACLQLAEGQYLDIELQRGSIEPTLANYDAMIAGKTGALFECACRLGALAANAPAGVVDAYAAYGRELGAAFQEQDDLLGVWGSAEEMGKSAASDIATRKRGLPIALALSEADAPAWLRSLYDSSGDDLRPDLVSEVVATLDTLGVREQAEARVRARYERAAAALASAAGREPAHAYLAAISDQLLGRRT